MSLGTVRVGNKRKRSEAAPQPWEIAVNIDRGSPLGNPYRITDGVGRRKVIALYRKALENDWNRNGPMRVEIERIAELVRGGDDVVLLCWCAPLPCHGDVVKDYVESMLV